MNQLVHTTNDAAAQAVQAVLALYQDSSTGDSITRAARAIAGTKDVDAASLPWHTLNAHQVRQVVAALKKEYAPATVNHTLSGIKVLMRGLFEQGLVAPEVYSAIEGVKGVRGGKRRVGHKITGGQEETLMSFTESARDEAMIALMLWGLRRVEVSRMNVSEVTAAGDHYEIIVHGKGDKTRVVPIYGEASDILRYYLDERVKMRPHEKDADALFLGGRGLKRRISVQGIHHVFDRARKAAGLEQLATHDCRRTFITRWLREGLGLLEAAYIVGHSSVGTTQVYAMEIENSAAEAAARFGNRKGD